MSPEAQALLAAALVLPPEDRAQLADEIHASLGERLGEAPDPTWVEEAERRLDDYEVGKTKGISMEEVFANLPTRKKQ